MLGYKGPLPIRPFVVLEQVALEVTALLDRKQCDLERSSLGDNIEVKALCGLVCSLEVSDDLISVVWREAPTLRACWVADYPERIILDPRVATYRVVGDWEVASR